MIGLGIYDLIVVSFFGIDSSISRFVQNSIFASPFVAYVFGNVSGHLFFYMPHTKMTKKLEDNLLDQGWIPPSKTVQWADTEDLPQFEAGDRVIGLVNFRDDGERTANPHICILKAKELGWEDVEDLGHGISDCDLWITEKDLVKGLVHDQSELS